MADSKQFELCSNFNNVKKAEPGPEPKHGSGNWKLNLKYVQATRRKMISLFLLSHIYSKKVERRQKMLFMFSKH